MAEIILLALWVGTSLFFIIREIKGKENRESHEMWLSEVKQCLHSIEREFQRKCEEVTENYFVQYIDIVGLRGYLGTSVKKLNDILSEYQEKINELKDHYLHRVNEKAIERMGKYRIEAVPDHLESEYKIRISNIVDTFHFFYNCLYSYRCDIELAHEYLTSPIIARKEFEEKCKKEVEDFIKQYER